MSPPASSQLPGFHALPLPERLRRLHADAGIPAATLAWLAEDLTRAQADLISENVVGLFGLPLAVATNFRIDADERLIPMAIEEPSVVAAASKAAKLARAAGGFFTETTGNVMIGQILLMDIADLPAAQRLLAARKQELLKRIPVSRSVAAAGGGPQELELRHLPDTEAGPMLVVHLAYDVGDAMGANIVNTAVEALAPWTENLTGGKAVARIVSNWAERRRATARVLYPWQALAAEPAAARRCIESIVRADAWARADPYRAATHNKGILNGVGSVALATGNDWRAAEAGAHAWAARAGVYAGLTRWTPIAPRGALPAPWSERAWTQDPRPALYGELTLPLALGTVGGVTRTHPAARFALDLLGQPSASRLAAIATAVGLAQNMAALYALTQEGIQRGHMRLHARQVALAAGIPAAQAAEVAHSMVAARTITAEAARRYGQRGRKQTPKDAYADG